MIDDELQRIAAAHNLQNFTIVREGKITSLRTTVRATVLSADLEGEITWDKIQAAMSYLKRGVMEIAYA